MAVYMPNAPTGTGERLVILGIAEDSPVTGPECHSPGQGDAGRVHPPGLGSVEKGARGRQGVGTVPSRHE
jgi:hypothetical protein